MAKKLMAIPLALAVVLGAQTVTFAETTDNTSTDNSVNTNTNTMDQNQVQDQNQAQTRGEAAIHPAGNLRIADLPAGHWATNATQVAVANNILPLINGKFDGNQQLTADELHNAMESLVNTAENISNQGALTDLRAVLADLPTGSQPVSRLQVAQAMSRFLNTASGKQLVAVAAPRHEAERFNDLGAHVPAAVLAVVDKYKVMTGYPDNTFRPNNQVTRYQMAAIALETLRDMQQAPIAQQPAAPVAVVPQPPTVVVVPPEQPQAPIAEVPPAPVGRPNFRERTPINLSWQALNSNNLNGTSGGAFNTIPVSGMFTGYQGPVMLQNVTNFRYDLYQSNALDTEFRLGYSDLKWGMLQVIPYVGFDLGLGTSIPKNATQYDTYAGATYGGIVSIMPTDNLEIFGTLGQAALLGAGRWNQNFQPISYPNALGSFLSNYGLGLDFYVSPNIALSLGVGTWQTPAQMNSTSSLANFGVINTYGGNIGVGFGF